jgi:CheY-specific phosphatase CheX
MEIKKIISDALMDAVVRVFSQSLGEVPMVTEKENVLQEIKGRIVSSIGLAGNLDGAIAMIVAEPVARKVVSKMFSFPEDGDFQDVLDGVGEIVNILAGELKTNLVNMAGYSFEISLPTVVHGETALSVCHGDEVSFAELLVQVGTLSFGVKCFYRLGDPENPEAVSRSEKGEEAAGTLKNMIQDKS